MSEKQIEKLIIYTANGKATPDEKGCFVDRYAALSREKLLMDALREVITFNSQDARDAAGELLAQIDSEKGEPG